ncbi:MAG: chemotaxis protein CheW [Myxococcus sp.]|nr:chemotaxis protein CheW [Myxococcus sp.]
MLAADAVAEVVAVVALEATPGPPSPIAGHFVCRGQPVVAVELGGLLEDRAAARPALDAHLVVLTNATALLVERVKALVTDVRFDEASPGLAVAPQHARVDQQVVPVLDLDQLTLWVAGRAA